MSGDALDRPAPGRVLAVDHGPKRIGVAVSDPLRLFARPLLTLEGSELADPARRVLELAVEWEASIVVVGIPLMPSGRAGDQAAVALAFADALRASIAAAGAPVEVSTVDESDSTREAEAVRGARRPRRAGEPGLDAVAAAVILERWLRER